MQSVILRYKFSISLCLADLSCFYKINILDVKGSLMSAIWLQSNSRHIYSLLDPINKAKLKIWIIRSANFGFSDGTALENTVKCSIRKFYNTHFPESMHKLSEVDVKTIINTLKLGYLDAIMSNIFLQQIHNEDIKPTFEHPNKWQTLELL